jgi:hypothetical protein
MADQRFDAAEALASAISSTELRQRRALSERAEAERDDAAEAAHLPRGECMLRMIRQPGVVNLSDLRVAGQKLRELERVGVVALHPDGQRLDPTQHEPRVHRPEDRPLGVLDEPQRLDVVVSHATATPPMLSLCPLRNLVVLCTTMSAPKSIGRCTYGLAKVLSTTTNTPWACARSQAARRSVIRRTGLVGVSRNSIFVAGRSAASMASVSDVST